MFVLSFPLYIQRVISHEGYYSRWHPGLVLRSGLAYQVWLSGRLHCHPLDPTIASTMASTTTDPSANANTSSHQMRTPGMVDEETPNPPSAIKRPKEAKLDKLKAQLKDMAGILKNRLEKRQEYLKSVSVANEGAQMRFELLLETCDDIITGTDPVEDVLGLLKEPFVDILQSEDILRNRLGGGMLPF